MIKKVTAILLYILFIHIDVNAQNMIGSSEIHILDFMSKVATDKKLIEHTKLPDGRSGIAYAHTDVEDVITIYNLKDGICTDYAVLYPKEALSVVVEAYNKSYIRQRANQWVNKELTLKLTLHVDEGSIMAMTFESIN